MAESRNRLAPECRGVLVHQIKPHSIWKSKYNICVVIQSIRTKSIYIQKRIQSQFLREFKLHKYIPVVLGTRPYFARGVFLNNPEIAMLRVWRRNCKHCNYISAAAATDQERCRHVLPTHIGCRRKLHYVGCCHLIFALGAQWHHSRWQKQLTGPRGNWREQAAKATLPKVQDVNALSGTALSPRFLRLTWRRPLPTTIAFCVRLGGSFCGHEAA